jgi:hypothetical protein
MGAVVNLTTKSGTNDLHGAVFEFLRNEKLDAKNLFAPSGPTPPFKRNQYGYAVGGPVPKIIHGKNKVFFFTWKAGPFRSGAARPPARRGCCRRRRAESRFGYRAGPRN